MTLILTLLLLASSAGQSALTVRLGYALYLTLLIGSLLLLEAAYPCRRAWGMQPWLFWRRDLPMLLLNGSAMGLTGALALAFLPLRQPGLNSLPWPLQTLLCLLLGDFTWYWLHRWSHRPAQGRWGELLWRLHVHHHLPAQVYVLMHPAAHPLHSALVRLLLLLSPWLLGASPLAAFAASVLTGYQGLLSHCNVDLRAGWLNHILIGTELHRQHHSACVAEAGNYGAVLTLWDRLFGTYRRPDKATAHALPTHLGVTDRHRYPADSDWPALLALPFRPPSTPLPRPPSTSGRNSPQRPRKP